MEKTIVTTGKTIDLAVQNALDQLGLDRDSVQVQVLAQAKSGFLGFGAQPAKVQVTYEAPDPVTPAPKAPQAALSSASRSKPKAKFVPAQEAKPAAPKAEKPETKPAAKPVETKTPAAAKAASETKAPKAPKAPRQNRETRPAAPDKVYEPAAPGSVEEKIETFINGLLVNMGSNAVSHAWKADGDTYRVDLTGEDLGYLIGHRGDTLDAIQHLANYAVGRTVDGHIRINVDAENYRKKREEGLTRYARKKAQQVLKARRRTTLEPMNAYERHVIHAALQDMENITTYSTGTEPNRRVVIEYVR